MRLPITLMLLACLVLSAGCSYKPVRHLASDAALIKPGESTRKDVLRTLGEPDSRRAIGAGAEEYIYAEEQKSQLSNLPLVGRMIGADSREMVVVILNGDQVTSCELRIVKADDEKWKKDAPWQEGK